MRKEGVGVDQTPRAGARGFRLAFAQSVTDFDIILLRDLKRKLDVHIHGHSHGHSHGHGRESSNGGGNLVGFLQPDAWGRRGICLSLKRIAYRSGELVAFEGREQVSLAVAAQLERQKERTISLMRKTRWGVLMFDDRLRACRFYRACKLQLQLQLL